MDLVDELAQRRDLPDEGLRELLSSSDDVMAAKLFKRARETAAEHFGREIYIRALIEWSNSCRNDCYYCGIRRSNHAIERYILSEEEILKCCWQAHEDGIRTFVLQGGENPVKAGELVGIVAMIKKKYPDSAVTLSLGELPAELYAALREAGADRYLLRHETATPSHYAMLHPKEMSLENRLECLHELRKLGFQTGMGMMVGSPFQTTGNLLADIRLLERFRPEMIGIGPFIPHPATPLGAYPAGSSERTLRLYAILRLMHPDALIPATTALSTLRPDGRTAGILAGANVIMPNFTPAVERAEYALYEGKASLAVETAENIRKIHEELSAIGRTVSPSRGDYQENHSQDTDNHV